MVLQATVGLLLVVAAYLGQLHLWLFIVVMPVVGYKLFCNDSFCYRPISMLVLFVLGYALIKLQANFIFYR